MRGLRDARRLVERVNAGVGAGLALEGLAEQGESGGAAFVRWPDGRPAVLTATPLSPSRVRHTAGILVHLDLTPGNILFDESGALTGVVDWHGLNGLARGDRRFGLDTLRFDLAWGDALDPDYPPVAPAAVEHLDSLLDAMPPDLVRRYWAHMSLRMVDWTIRHHGPADIDHQLAFAATRLGGSRSG